MSKHVNLLRHVGRDVILGGDEQQEVLAAADHLAELERQNRVLKAELKVQAVMWKHAREGKHLGPAGAGVVPVGIPVAETAEKHARLALLRAKKGNAGKKLAAEVGLTYFSRPPKKRGRK